MNNLLPYSTNPNATTYRMRFCRRTSYLKITHKFEGKEVMQGPIDYIIPQDISFFIIAKERTHFNI